MCGKSLWITGLVEGKIYRKLWFSRWIPFFSHFFPSKSPQVPHTTPHKKQWGLLLWRSSRRSSTRNTRRLGGALPSWFLVILSAYKTSMGDFYRGWMGLEYTIGFIVICHHLSGGFLKARGTLVARWFTMENPNLKWMMTGGSPIYGNPHMDTGYITSS